MSWLKPSVVPSNVQPPSLQRECGSIGLPWRTRSAFAVLALGATPERSSPDEREVDADFIHRNVDVAEAALMGGDDDVGT